MASMVGGTLHEVSSTMGGELWPGAAARMAAASMKMMEMVRSGRIHAVSRGRRSLDAVPNVEPVVDCQVALQDRTEPWRSCGARMSTASNFWRMAPSTLHALKSPWRLKFVVTRLTINLCMWSSVSAGIWVTWSRPFVPHAVTSRGGGESRIGRGSTGPAPSVRGSRISSTPQCSSRAIVDWLGCWRTVKPQRRDRDEYVHSRSSGDRGPSTSMCCWFEGGSAAVLDSRCPTRDFTSGPSPSSPLSTWPGIGFIRGSDEPLASLRMISIRRPSTGSRSSTRGCGRLGISPWHVSGLALHSISATTDFRRFPR